VATRYVRVFSLSIEHFIPIANLELLLLQVRGRSAALPKVLIIKDFGAMRGR